MASPLNRPVTPLVALLAFLAGISVSNIALAQDKLTAVPTSHHDSSQSAILTGKERTRPPIVELRNSSLSTAVFIENLGQFDPKVRFQVKTGGQTAWLTAEGVVFDAVRATSDTKREITAGSGRFADGLKPQTSPNGFDLAKQKFRTVARLVFSEDFVGASCCLKVEGKDPQPGVYNYFQSRDPKEWRTNVRSYAEVIYRDVWPGIDLRVYGNGPDLEQEFIVQPGGDLSRVQITYRGINGLNVAKDGSLEVATAFGTLRETKPRLYQEMKSKKVTLQGQYRVTGKTSYTFDVEAHNPLFALVIDPTLLYSTFLGGSAGLVSGNVSEQPTGIAVDASGDAYVAGYTISTDFPTTTGALQPTTVGAGLYGTAFITKLNATGSKLVYSTYLGQASHVSAIAVDASGNAYVTGITGDTYYGHVFPTTSNAYWPADTLHTCSPSDFYVSVINSTGNGLVYSTCLNIDGSTAYGAEYGYYPHAIAADSHGRAFITGGVTSYIPTTANAYQPSYPGAGSAVFVSVFDTTKSGSSSLVYSTYLGGSLNSGVPGNPGPIASGIAVDSSGKIYIAGAAYNGFPITSGAFQPSHSPDRQTDAFIAKLDPSSSGLSSLIYSTYLGGSPGCSSGCSGSGAAAIAVDGSGEAFVAGDASAGSFPVTPGAFETSPVGGLGGHFIAKLNAGGSNLVYSTFLYYVVSINALAIDSAGDAYVVGNTHSASFPVTPDAFQSTCKTDCSDAFLSKLNPTGSALVYSSFLGGATGDDIATAVAVDQTGDAYVAGYTTSVDFPVTGTAFQPALNLGGGTTPEDAFVTKFPLGIVQTLSISSLTPTSGGNAGMVTLSIQGGGFHNGASVSLVGGSTITGNTPVLGSEGRTISVAFDLRAAPVGAYALVVTNPDKTKASLPDAFTVLQGGAPNIDLTLTGLAVNHGSNTNVVLETTISNKGKDDGAGGILIVPANSGFTFTSTYPPAFITDSTDGAQAHALSTTSSLTIPPSGISYLRNLPTGQSQVVTSTARSTTSGAAACSAPWGPVCFTQNLAAWSACVVGGLPNCSVNTSASCKAERNACLKMASQSWDAQD